MPQTEHDILIHVIQDAARKDEVQAAALMALERRVGQVESANGNLASAINARVELDARLAAEAKEAALVSARSRAELLKHPAVVAVLMAVASLISVYLARLAPKDTHGLDTSQLVHVEPHHEEDPAGAGAQP